MSQLGKYTGDGLVDLVNGLDSFRNALFRDPFFRDHSLENLTGLTKRAVNQTSAALSYPRCDHQVTETQHLYKLDLPGLEKADVKLTVDREHRVLKVTGERKNEVDKDTNDGGHYKEVSYGSFSRSLSLTDDADADSCKATFEKGVLTVSFDRDVKSVKDTTFNVDVV